MTRKMLKSKIHRATVTGADLNYEGSISIDKNLMDAADILPHEAVDIWNVSAGTRFQTYAVEAPPHSGIVCINGAAARLVSRGDLVIIASWVEMDAEAARQVEPKLLFVDENNVQTNRVKEVGGQTERKKWIRIS
jgi:aspartate 1-decarboxylase